ncbi:ATP-binding protein [Nocardia sp. NBC_00403]|uniref:ATP-binding protein n=1 Tax=Nocardia sp. NBC_00403 TaxID=2975990 RepID=UPI002E230917
MRVGRDICIHYTVVQQPALRPRVTDTLLRDVGMLVGRRSELAQIVSAAGQGRVVSIYTVDGMAGVGKTALVTHAAHRLAAGFPDGQYFVELHAHTPGQAPTYPADALARLLTDVGVDPNFLPPTLEGRRDLWRDRVAGKRVLLVLDDARDHTQVEPLLPGAGDCLTLITSRRHLTALDGAVPLPLDVLDPEAASKLFITLASRAADTDGEQAAVAEIVRLCGFLPLAIVLLAGRLAHHPVWTIAGLAGEFAAAQDRLGELEAGPRAVRVAFTMSYQSLPPEQQRMFRFLGLHPGLDIDAHAAAALAGVSVMVARTQLEAFYIDHLVEEAQPGHYRMHDLLRAYARTQADTDPPETSTRVVDRLLDYYQATTAAADQYLARRTRPTARPSTIPQDGVVREFGDEVQALAWMRTERANLLACIDHAFNREPRRVIELTETLASLLERDGPWLQAATLHQRALAAAEHLDDHIGEANTLANLGRVREWSGDYAEAIDLHQQALTLYRGIGSRLGEANTLASLGSVRRLTGDYAESVDLHQRALTRFCEIGNQLGEANTLMNLGLVRKETGDYAKTGDLYQQALTLYREIGNQLGEANALMNLGNVRKETGNYAESVDLHQQALALFREIGHRQGEATTFNNLGLVRRSTGDSAESGDLHQQALILYRETGNRLGEAFALTGLGSVRQLTGDYAESGDLHQRALVLFREIGHRLGEAEVLNQIGMLLMKTGEPDKALEMFTDALTVARTIRSQLEQAHALEGAARCRVGVGDTVTAVTELREAVEIYYRLAVPEAEPAAAYLLATESTPPSH